MTWLGTEFYVKLKRNSRYSLYSTTQRIHGDIIDAFARKNTPSERGVYIFSPLCGIAQSMSAWDSYESKFMRPCRFHKSSS